MNCSQCEDTGWYEYWGISYPCCKCEKGKEEQHKSDLLKEEKLKEELKRVRGRIKYFEKLKGEK